MDDNQQWRTSNRCLREHACVGVRAAGDGSGDVLVADTNAPGRVLRFTRTEFAAFVGGAKDGDFDDLVGRG